MLYRPLPNSARSGAAACGISVNTSVNTGLSTTVSRRRAGSVAAPVVGDIALSAMQSSRLPAVANSRKMAHFVALSGRSVKDQQNQLVFRNLHERSR
jgi:hypothetical protein